MNVQARNHSSCAEQLERARGACLSLPQATEQEAWGEPTFRIGKKLFAMFASADNHHGAGRSCLWCKAPLGVQELLVRSEPGKFFVPPYVGVKGWIGVVLEAVDDDELYSLAVQSYCLIASKKLRALVDALPPRRLDNPGQGE